MSEKLTETMNLMEVRTDGLVERPKIRDIKIDTTKAKGFDAKKEMERIAEEAKAAKSDAGLTIDIFSVSRPSITAGTDVTSLLLEQVRKLIIEKKFPEAMKKLADILQNQPDHPEALYFRAYCLLNIDSTDEQQKPFAAELEALIILCGLFNKSRDNGFSDKIEALKTTVCAHLKEKVPVIFLKSILAGPDKFLNAIQDLVATISEFIRLDPKCADYYGLKAIVWMQMG